MIAQAFDVFLFDLDGVVYVGDEPVPGAPQTLDRLRSMGRTLRFLTNDPRPDRDQLRRRLSEMGLEAGRSELVSSGWATAQHLAEQGFASAYVVGSEGLHNEVRRAGIRISDRDPDAVVSGPDFETTYRDLQTATRLILDGARFVATNPDTLYPTTGGMSPASGALTRALQAAVGRRPRYIGKPYASMFEAALSTTEGSSAVMIGDNPRTDILGAHRYGIPAILFGGSDEDPPSRYHRPDDVITDFQALFEEDRAVPGWESQGYPWPETIRTRVGVVILDRDSERIWLDRSPATPSPTLPRGRIQAGESVERALRRLLRHRALELEQIDGLVGVYSDPSRQVRTDSSGRPVQDLELVFRVRAHAPEQNEQQWWDPGEATSRVPDERRGWLSDALEFSGHPSIR